MTNFNEGYYNLFALKTGFFIFIIRDEIVINVHLDGNLEQYDFKNKNPVERGNFEFQIKVIGDIEEYQESGGARGFFDRTYRNKDITWFGESNKVIKALKIARFL